MVSVIIEGKVQFETMRVQCLNVNCAWPSSARTTASESKARTSIASAMPREPVDAENQMRTKDAKFLILKVKVKNRLR